MRDKVSLFNRAEKYGSKVAIVDNEEKLTYADLLTKSKAVATELLASNKDLNEEHIAFAVPPGKDYAVIQWGIWQAGGAVVPLNIKATLPEMKHCIETAGVKRLIASINTVNVVSTLCEQLGIELIILEDLDMSKCCQLPDIAVERRAMLLFTSGTTNKPKAVVSTHKNIEAQVTSLIDFWQWQTSDVIPLFLPMHHVHGIINVLTCGLWAGATVIAHQKGFDIKKILEQVSENTYTVFMAVPTIYVKIINQLTELSNKESQAICQGFNKMRLMISGSAALPIKIHKQWQALTGQILLERYGMTEIGMGISNPVVGERRPGAVGIALPGVQVQLTAENGNAVTEQNTPGEILIKGDNVFNGYWNNIKATEESFKDGWFRTGDMAVIEKGYYRIMGRLSVDIIKSGGYKLSALEIENYLLEHSNIKECAVLGINDETWGEVVAVVIVLKDGGEMSVEELQSWSKDKMSSYKTPRKIINLKELPKNAMGKVVKPELKKLFL